jgi:hypothetical protein
MEEGKMKKKKEVLRALSAFPRHDVDRPTSMDLRNINWEIRMHTNFSLTAPTKTPLRPTIRKWEDNIKQIIQKVSEESIGSGLGPAAKFYEHCIS